MNIGYQIERNSELNSSPQSIEDQAFDSSNVAATNTMMLKTALTFSNKRRLDTLRLDEDDMRKPFRSPPPRRSFFPRARGATMGFEYRPVR